MYKAFFFFFFAGTANYVTQRENIFVLSLLLTSIAQQHKMPYIYNYYFFFCWNSKVQ